MIEALEIELLAKETHDNWKIISCHKPYQRVVVDKDLWLEWSEALRSGKIDFLGIWGDENTVHMGVRNPASEKIVVISYVCEDGKFPSLNYLPSIRFERSIKDIFGLIPEGIKDNRPWLDHGVWAVQYPLGKNTKHKVQKTEYSFLPSSGESIHQVAVGPVHAGIIEPGHFRFTAFGEAVVRLEERFGYTHKGTESLMQAATLEEGAKLAGRVSGDSTVAYATAFARTVEAATEHDIPVRAKWLRALMLELERIANHIGDIGAICNDAAFAIMHSYCGILREQLLRNAEQYFGHRLMMDKVIPGGVTTDISQDNLQHLAEFMPNLRGQFDELITYYDNSISLKDRTVGTGVVSSELVHSFCAGGVIGRSSGRNFDARRDISYEPYNKLKFDVPILKSGDVNARIWLRNLEVKESISVIEQIIKSMPQGDIFSKIKLNDDSMEGMALVEGFRGDILAWIRIGKHGKIQRCYLRDPSWLQWPIMEDAIEGNIIADFPLCNKSFNCSYSGCDL